jgi:L-fuconolactonase
MNNASLSRRDFIGAVAAAAAGSLAPRAFAAGASPAMNEIPIIDTHIHLFDPNRPQGVPWPPKNNAKLYKPALPPRYRALAVPLGIKGAIEVEASAWLEDNQWVLEVAAGDPIMVGMIGSLEVGEADFRKNLDRFARNPLFRGIRHGNLWGRNLAASIGKPEFISDMKALADAGLVLDTANPDLALIDGIVKLSDKVPSLRIVIDHLPKIVLPPPGPALDAYRANLREIHQRPQIFVKMSAVLREENGKISHDLAFYRPRLDEIWEVFGEDRIVYGSDWPNSDQVGEYHEVLAIVRAYFATKTRAQAEKYFWKNSLAAYRWVKRDPSQPA